MAGEKLTLWQTQAQEMSTLVRENPDIFLPPFLWYLVNDGLQVAKKLVEHNYLHLLPGGNNPSNVQYLRGVMAMMEERGLPLSQLDHAFDLFFAECRTPEIPTTEKKRMASQVLDIVLSNLATELE